MTLHIRRSALLSLISALALSSGIAAERFSRLWSIAVHLEYVDGTSYDVVFARGVETQEVSSVLAECGRNHRAGAGAVVQYHCYPIPE